MALNVEQQLQLVADYKSGVHRVALTEKYSITPPRLYAYLRQHGVQPNRCPKKPRLCVVCGDPKPLPPYRPSAIWSTTFACKEMACKTLLIVRPDLRPRPPQMNQTGRVHKRPIGNDFIEYDKYEDIIELTESELATLCRAFRISQDERGADLTEEQRKALYGRASQLTVAVHTRARAASETSMSLPKNRTQKEFLKRYFGGDESLASAFDVIYLWSCGCPNQTSYVLRSLNELPDEKGEYGFCSYCGAAALEVI